MPEESGQKIPMLREIIEERKNKAVETLSANYAKDRLPLEEYERLVEYINKIESERELVIIENIVAGYSGPGANAADSAGKTGGAGNDDYKQDDFEPDDYESNRFPGNFKNFRNFGFTGGLAFLSSRTFSGPVKPGSQFISFFGSHHIKIRKCDLCKKKTSLEVVSFLGETVILVEPGIQVNNNVVPILGEAHTDKKIFNQYNQYNNNDNPEISISGIALMGSVTVKPLRDK
ncbi:MAG: hypothetical protein FWD78_13255 [Treponema sp.]|nr:hypothetical protein [Treponema sp.]